MKNRIDKESLTIPLYLNTKVVFDMLATLEDGFSTVRSISTSSSQGKDEIADATIGSNNLFALLCVGVNGNLKTSEENDSTVIEEKTHTPVSLFQRLKRVLEKNSYIQRNIEKAQVGDFIEIQGILSTNPLIDMLTGIKEISTLLSVFSDDKNINAKNKKDRYLSDNRFKTQIEALIEGLQSNGKIDIICKTGKYNVILPTEQNFFINNNMNEITDGNYRILGKVVQIYRSNGEGEISLLRNTAFSKMKLDRMKEFQDLVKDSSLTSLFGENEFITSVKAPVAMIIPIAIYV